MNNTDIWVRQGNTLTFPCIQGLYRLSDFRRARTDMMAKDVVGKPVVVPDAVAG